MRMETRTLLYLTLKSQNIELTLCPLGASIYRLKYKGEDMVVTPENISDFEKLDVYFGKTVGLIAGRVKNEDGSITLHGGKDGLSTKYFVTSVFGNKVTFTHKTSDISITVVYELFDSSLKITYYALPLTETAVALTNHTYYCLGESDVDHLSLQMDCKQCIRYDEELIPQELVNVDKSKDFRDGKAIDGKIDNCFLFDKQRILVLKSDRFLMGLETDFDGVIVFTDHFEDGVKTFKSDKTERRGLAIEPQDSQLDRKVLKPHEPYKKTMSLYFKENENYELYSNYRKLYGNKATNYVQSGGRFEMLGNHTDHNHGKTLASTCSLVIKGVYFKEENNIVKLYSKDNCQFVISLDNTDVVKDETGTSKCFVRGVADYLKKRGYKIGGFSAYLESMVPPGSGVSSSAAFEVLIGKIFNELYNDNKIPLLDICKAGQYAENNYFGKKSGLLDQIACASMGVSYIDFKNIESPKIEILHNAFDGYQFVIVDTGKSHADLSDLYSSITDDMRNAAKKMGHEFLRECNEEELEKVKDKLTDGEYSRATHFFNENKRVEKALNCLKKKDFAGYFACVKESEHSSRTLLKNAMVNEEYEGSLAQAIDISNFAMDNNGASKINGGGFGGSIIAIVPNDKLEHYLKVMTEKYGKEHVFPVKILNQGE